jgi:glycerate-2-kinase
MGIEELKQVSIRIQNAARAAADPGAAVRRSLSLTPHGFSAQGRDVAVIGALSLIAVGKASLAMTEAALEILGPALHGGLGVTPHGHGREARADPRLTVLHAGHPVPDLQGLEAARQVAARVREMAPGDACLFLLSGGASSLLPLPAPELSLDDLRRTTSLLLQSGADIRELNIVRKHLGGLGGGRLAQACRGTLVTLALSDVVGDDLSVIGSGPTVADPSSFSEAAQVLGRYGLSSAVPPAVRARLEEGKAGRVEELEAAAAEARASGFPPWVITRQLAGEARDAGRMMAAEAIRCRGEGRPVRPPACLLAAGETTVTVRGAGTGGRNQELALAAAELLDGRPGILLTSFATDGIEGNSEAAGAYASGLTVGAGTRAGRDPADCLLRNDAGAFLSAAGELIVTGPTGTNVNDLSFVLIE